MTAGPTYHSEIDASLGLPGDARSARAAGLAIETATLDPPAYETPTWREIEALDAAEGYATRRAVRGILRRPSDDRFLIFRYPFADGSFRFVLPGGGADPGENPTQALEREVFEETGTHAGDLRFSGLVLYHLLAGSTVDAGRVPTIQYSPVMVGTIADDLPDTGGRAAHWFTLDEFEAQPRRPISDPIIEVLRATEQAKAIEPVAIWLPA